MRYLAPFPLLPLVTLLAFGAPAPSLLLWEDFRSLPEGPMPFLAANEPGVPVFGAQYHALPEGWRHYGEVFPFHPVYAPEEQGEPLPKEGLRWYAVRTDNGMALTKDPWDVGMDGWYGPTSLPSNQWALAPLRGPMNLEGDSVYAIRLRFQFDNTGGLFQNASESNRIDLALFAGDAVPPLESLPAMSRDIRAMVTYRMNPTGEWGLNSNLHTHYPNGDGPIDGHLVYREFSPVALPVRWRDGGLQSGFMLRRDMRAADLSLLDEPPPHIDENGFSPARTNRGFVPASPEVSSRELFGWGPSRFWQEREGGIWEVFWILRGRTNHDHYVRDPMSGEVGLSFQYRQPASFAWDPITHVAFLYRPEIKMQDEAPGFQANRTFIHEIEVRRVIPGDLNLDGTITAAEIETFLANLGQQGGWKEGDMNGDGVIDQRDAVLILRHAAHLRGTAQFRALYAASRAEP